jgi:hypothetical protein
LLEIVHNFVTIELPQTVPTGTPEIAPVKSAGVQVPHGDVAYESAKAGSRADFMNIDF